MAIIVIGDHHISIHALLAESDVKIKPVLISTKFLSTLSLRRATTEIPVGWWKLQFLSTLSLRRATCDHLPVCAMARNFYPRSPCGERHNSRHNLCPRKGISIHALLAESDNTGQPVRGLPSYFYPRSPCGERLRAWTCTRSANRFLSTLSLRRATIRAYQRHFPPDISIHALLAESDL